MEGLFRALQLSLGCPRASGSRCRVGHFPEPGQGWQKPQALAVSGGLGLPVALCPACALGAGALGARSGVGVSQGVSMRTPRRPQVRMLPPQQWTEEMGETGVEGKRVEQKPSQEP